jgi:hypothetical protein
VPEEQVDLEISKFFSFSGLIQIQNSLLNQTNSI